MATAREVYAVLGNETLWDTAQRCDRLLRAAGIPYAVAGGVAVCLHGYQRNTVDLDLLIQPSDQDAVRQAMGNDGFSWSEAAREFRARSGAPVQILLAGERAGKDAEVKLPNPAEQGVIIEREGLCVLSLARLIESKLACGQGNLRRTHKDFADVIELIVVHSLDGAFSRYVHKSVRAAFRQLVKQASAGE